jgi:adenosylmethionine-8-amino-7-oxononanoate aminotransferase
LFKQESLLEKMQPRIAYLARRLREDFLPLAHVSDARQWGYMIGIELVQDKANRKNYAPEQRIGHKVIFEARQQSVLIRPLGDIIILMPPLGIGDGELATLLDVTYDCIRAVTGD